MKMKNISTYFTRTACALLLLAVSAGCEAFPTDDSGFTPETPELSIRANEVENVPREKTTLTIPVESNLPWRAGTDASWISFEKARGTGDGDCIISVALNTSRDERTGTVRIWITDDAVKTFRITQAPTVAGENPMDYYVKTDGDGTADGLSWANATTLENALNMAAFGDKVHLAAGTYTPYAPVAGGSLDNASDKTFELNSNITLIGGYPSDATEGAISAPAVNETIFSGETENGTVSHVVVVTAVPDPDFRLKIQGITITGGKAQTNRKVTINGTSVDARSGGGIVIVASAVDFVNCKIKDNTAQNNGNIVLHNGSDVKFENCVISDNIHSGNNGGAGIYNDTSTLTVDNCTFENNRTSHFGTAIYAVNTNAKSYNYIYNSTFTKNVADHNTRQGGAIYSRENSETVIVNSTFMGNTGGKGGAIAVYGANGKTTKLDIVNCTITGNTAKSYGGGINISNSYCITRIYNTIVSGNSDPKNSDLQLDDDGGQAVLSAGQSYVNGSQIYDVNSILLQDISFDAETMLGPLSDNGGKTQTVALKGPDNPALTNGMGVPMLRALQIEYSQWISKDVIILDQRGVSRDGKAVIGAWVNE